jgi:hypothetical protein
LWPYWLENSIDASAPYALVDTNGHRLEIANHAKISATLSERMSVALPAGEMIHNAVMILRAQGPLLTVSRAA